MWRRRRRTGTSNNAAIASVSSVHVMRWRRDRRGLRSKKSNVCGDREGEKEGGREGGGHPCERVSGAEHANAIARRRAAARAGDERGP